MSSSENCTPDTWMNHWKNEVLGYKKSSDLLFDVEQLSDCNWLKDMVISRGWLSCPVRFNQHRNGAIPHFLNQKDRHTAWLNAVPND